MFWPKWDAPLTAAYAVRDSTQISRNSKEVALLKEKVKNQGIKVQSFTIFFPEKNSETGKAYNQPLSWRLTEQQKNNWKLAWQDVKKSSNFEKLKTLWQEEWKIPKKWKDLTAIK
mgnify:CR=1 FL=1